MLGSNDIHGEISGIKKRLGDKIRILGHHYQSDAIARHCDVMGDSLELARRIPHIKAEHIIFCGVYFMGETAALLAKKNQQIHLPEKMADCMMSRMATGKMAENALAALNKKRRIIPLAYVNTMLELKEVVGRHGGAVCTSANADKMLAWALSQGDGVLFLPDRHLGQNTAKKLGIPENEQAVLRLNKNGLAKGYEIPDAKLYLWPGCCAVHGKFSPRNVEELKKKNPGAKLLAHPECRQEVITACDGSGSTSFLIKAAGQAARDSPGSTLLIGTEENLVRRLARKYADSIEIMSFGKAICKHMAATTPEKLLETLRAIENGQAENLKIEDGMRANAALAIDRMLAIME